MPAVPRFSRLGAQTADLQVAAADRLHDAEVLFAAGCFASAIAMGIYSLEIHLKVLICRRLNLAALPKPFEIHELDSLLVLSGLQAALDSAPPDVKFNWDQAEAESLQINEMRYLPSGCRSRTDAEDFLRELRDPPFGVLPWLLAQP
jgi:hypothetical protein